MNDRRDTADGSEDRRPVDTRDEGGPEGRTYMASFATVWDSVADQIASHRGWEILHADEERGLYTVTCRSRFRRTADDLSIWVRLDENGLTRLDVRSDHREGRLDAMAARRRVTDLLTAIDAVLGPGARVRG